MFNALTNEGGEPTASFLLQRSKRAVVRGALNSQSVN